jgi:DNA-binding transcriptional ArsR family regulator
MKKMITEFDKLLTKEDELTKDEFKIKKKSTLMNPSRCIIFEYLCGHPCSSVSSIANGLSLSESRVRWHLEKLVWDRLVTIQENGSTVYLPSNMINPEHIKIFRLLALEKSSAIIASIKSKQGLYQNELSKTLDLNTRTVMKYTSDLEYFGIIRCAFDGKFKRYYLTDLMDDLRKYYKRNSKNFKEQIIKKTKQGGLRPKILLSTPEVLKLKLIAGTKIRVLTIPMIPFNDMRYGLRNMKKERHLQKKGLISFT